MSLSRLAELVSIRTISPAYLSEADHPWLRALLDERERFVGHKRRHWKIRVGEPMPIAAPRTKLGVALRVLDRMAQDQASGAVRARKARAVVFGQAAKEPEPAIALAQAASLLGMSPKDTMDCLFADLPDERKLAPLPAPTAPCDLALACNAAIVASLLSRALRIRIVARGQVRAVVRHIRLMGLLCHAVPGAAKDEVSLEVSGPYALFRHTRIYGRALGSLVPRLAWCNSYRLEADCVLDSGTTLGRLVLGTGDPVAPARELPAFDSKVEERFARAFAKLARDWDVVREPQPVAVQDALIFPDFELRHRASGERWMLEIVGYWTADYVRKKLAMLRRANIERLIVCIDEERCCADAPLDLDARIVLYRRKVDPRAVLAIVDPGALTVAPASPRSRKAAAR
ncbi:MAG TPA: DUF790 family protein [Polyangiales bacterium]